MIKRRRRQAWVDYFDNTIDENAVAWVRKTPGTFNDILDTPSGTKMQILDARKLKQNRAIGNHGMATHIVKYTILEPYTNIQNGSISYALFIPQIGDCLSRTGASE